MLRSSEQYQMWWHLSKGSWSIHQLDKCCAILQNWSFHKSRIPRCTVEFLKPNKGPGLLEMSLFRNVRIHVYKQIRKFEIAASKITLGQHFKWRYVTLFVQGSDLYVVWLVFNVSSRFYVSYTHYSQEIFQNNKKKHLVKEAVRDVWVRCL